MGIGIFDRLGFPASMANNTIAFSESTQNSLANLPPILLTWQMEDIANSNVSNYYVNPVSANANTLISLITDIENLAANGDSNLATIYANANSILVSGSIISFRQHTDRLSGVTPLDVNNVEAPTFENCIGVGKALTYIVYQSDGISNNAVMMGNFGSLYTGNTLDSYIITLTNDKALINAYGNTLTSNDASNIVSDMLSMNTFINTSVTTDVNYYANTRSVMNDYNSVKGFTRPGDTEKELYNLIGSEKLKERL
jgi:hypothetical protein